jgi:hypothetical protein
MPNLIEHWRQRDQQMRAALSGSAQVSATLSVTEADDVLLSDGTVAEAQPQAISAYADVLIQAALGRGPAARTHPIPSRSGRISAVLRCAGCSLMGMRGKSPVWRAACALKAETMNGFTEMRSIRREALGPAFPPWRQAVSSGMHGHGHGDQGNPGGDVHDPPGGAHDQGGHHEMHEDEN